MTAFAFQHVFETGNWVLFTVSLAPQAYFQVDPEAHGSRGNYHAPVVRTVRHDISEKPFIVIWEVTRACGLVCKHCRANAQYEPHPLQLSTIEGKVLLKTLVSYSKPEPFVVLTGGDPFERDDLEGLVRFGTEHGLNMSLPPSVTPRLTPERIKSPREARGKTMLISLNGATAQTRDKFRGFSGTFEKTLKVAPHINEVDYRLQINSTLTKGNIYEAPTLLKTVMEIQAKMWYVFFLVPTGRGADLGVLSPEEHEDVLHWLSDMSNRITIKTTEAPQYRRIVMQQEEAKEKGLPPYEGGELCRCSAGETTKLSGAVPEKPRRPHSPMAVNSGSGFVFIDHISDVHPSGFLPLHCGSVKVASFQEIYANSPVFKALRDPDNWHGKCSVCECHSVCGGSRSMAYALTGGYTAPDPTCIYIPPRWATVSEEERQTSTGQNAEAGAAQVP